MKKEKSCPIVLLFIIGYPLSTFTFNVTDYTVLCSAPEGSFCAGGQEGLDTCQGKTCQLVLYGKRFYSVHNV